MSTLKLIALPRIHRHTQVPSGSNRWRSDVHAENARHAAVAAVVPVQISDGIEKQTHVFAIAARVVGGACSNGEI